MAKVNQKKNQIVGNKIKKIMHEGVRRNTHQPVSKSNKRRPVSQKQAIAIAESMYRRKKI
ncbi:MAG: hypothetical protein KGL39_54415 [Patescibacteria group bacterium]|nr:hypothetical protein [Patescibacteria group bacterium]